MVKKVFPLLLSYVFLTTQCWALDGGPDYGRGIISTIGTYSGVINGLTESDAATAGGPDIPGDPLPNPADTTTSTNSNALGLFDLSVPVTGTATGAFLLFADGYVFGGTIDGSVDPDTKVLKGIVQGTYSFTLGTFDAAGDAVSTSVTAQAIGMINATINATKAPSLVESRITGTANLEINFGEVDVTTLAPIVDRVITFSVSGFKQSDVATSTVASIGTTTTTD